MNATEKAERLKLAVQKSGRLTDHSLELLKNCGLKLSRGRDQLTVGVIEASVAEPPLVGGGHHDPAPVAREPRAAPSQCQVAPRKPWP